jgi:hypothetical protein
MCNGNENIRDFYDFGNSSKFLKPHDVFTLKGGRDNSLHYFQITTVREVRLAEKFKGTDGGFTKSQFEVRAKRELSDTEVINVYEFKRTYEWKIDRTKV